MQTRGYILHLVVYLLYLSKVVNVSIYMREPLLFSSSIDTKKVQYTPFRRRLQIKKLQGFKTQDLKPIVTCSTIKDRQIILKTKQWP